VSSALDAERMEEEDAEEAKDAEENLLAREYAPIADAALVSAVN
jgi:hypothetical protein